MGREDKRGDCPRGYLTDRVRLLAVKDGRQGELTDPGLAGVKATMLPSLVSQTKDLTVDHLPVRHSC